MNQLNQLLQDLGISKVRLSKYLGVSRQMVYNYLELDSISKWPKEKKILLFKLLGVEDGDENTLSNIKVTTDYLLEVESRLNDGVKETVENEFLDLKGLKKEEHNLISDITFLIKDKLMEPENHEDNYYALQYFYHVLQSMDNVPEIKYLLAYLSKATGFTELNEFKFNEDKQYILEGLIHYSFSLYNSGATNKSMVIKARERFVQDIESRKEEKLSRTQQLTTTKIQALKELGYTSLNSQNAAEVFEKMAEIDSRKV